MGSAFIATLTAAGGAPNLGQLYLHSNALIGPPFAEALTKETVLLPSVSSAEKIWCVALDGPPCPWPWYSAGLGARAMAVVPSPLDAGAVVAANHGKQIKC